MIKIQKFHKEIINLIGENNLKDKKIKNLKDIENWDSLKYMTLVSHVESFLKKRLTEKEIIKLQKIYEIKKLIQLD